jgi:hypothetical protein
MMTEIRQSLRKKGSLFLLLLGVLMLAASLSRVAAADTPACDGVSCQRGSDCGTKCVCNVTGDDGGVCLDIIQID